MTRLERELKEQSLLNIILDLDSQGITKIITNGLIGSIFHDLKNYIKYNEGIIVLDIDSKIYKIGSIKNVNIYIDPYIRFTDNTISYNDTKIDVSEIVKDLI